MDKKKEKILNRKTDKIEIDVKLIRYRVNKTITFFERSLVDYSQKDLLSWYTPEALIELIQSGHISIVHKTRHVVDRKLKPFGRSRHPS